MQCIWAVSSSVFKRIGFTNPNWNQLTIVWSATTIVQVLQVLNPANAPAGGSPAAAFQRADCAACCKVLAPITGSSISTNSSCTRHDWLVRARRHARLCAGPRTPTIRADGARGGVRMRGCRRPRCRMRRGPAAPGRATGGDPIFRSAATRTPDAGGHGE